MKREIDIHQESFINDRPTDTLSFRHDNKPMNIISAQRLAHILLTILQTKFFIRLGLYMKKKKLVAIHKL